MMKLRLFWFRGVSAATLGESTEYPLTPERIAAAKPRNPNRLTFWLLIPFLLLPLLTPAQETRRPEENPKPILDAPSLRIPAAPAYPTTLAALGYADGDELLQDTPQIQSSVLSVAFDGGGQLAAGSSDGTVKLWDVRSGELKQILQAQSSVLSVAFDGGQLAFGSDSGTIKLWDMRSSKLKQTLQAQSPVLSVAFDHGGQLASGSSDGTIKLWDVHSGELKQTLQAQSPVKSIAFGDSGQLASGSYDGTIKLWNMHNGELHQILRTHTDWVLPVAFDGGGQLATGSSDGTVKLWDVHSGELKYTLQAHTNWVRSLAFNGNGQLASGSSDGTVKLWDAHSGELKQTLQTQSRVLSVAFDGGGQLAAGSYNGMVKLWEEPFKGGEAHVLLAGVRGLWLSMRPDGNIRLADDGGLLQPRNLRDAGYRWWALPKPDSSKVTWTMKAETVSLDLQGGKGMQAVSFVLHLENTDICPLHRPRILTTRSADDLFQIIPAKPQPAYPQAEAIYSRTSLIPPGETAWLTARVLTVGEQPTPSGTYTLPVTVEVSGGVRKSVALTINLKTPNIVVMRSDFSIFNNTLKISLHNQGRADLPKAHFYLRDPAAKLKLPPQALDGIPAQTEAPALEFELPDSTSRAQRNRLQLEIRPMRPPLYTRWYVPLEITLMPAYLAPLLVAVSVVLLGFSGFYWRRYRHPLVLTLGTNPQALYRLSLEQLGEAQRRLHQTGRLAGVLDSADISRDSWRQALDFAQAGAEWKARVLALRLGGQLGEISVGSAVEKEENLLKIPPGPPFSKGGDSPPFEKGGLGGIFHLKLPATFPLNVDRVLLYFPDCDARDAITRLKAVAQAEGRITLIIGPDSAYQRQLLTITQDLSNKYVAPQSRQLSELLLSPDAETALAKLLAEQLALKQISPYQIGGGVNKETVFFGRRELLAQIINRDPANYLLVGGRQMGKSTLLKALERRYADNPNVACYYHTLSNEILLPRLAQTLKLPPGDNAESFAAALEQHIHDRGRHFIFLIDEADRFIAHEQARDYPVLNLFRRLSEQGQCSFILAGFWQLYQHAVLDYQSPLRNFGEVLEVGALERDACYQLATCPMHSMNLGYANDAIVQEMVNACGRRANLIAYACHQLIHNLDARQRTIEAGDIQRVLHSRDMHKRFEGWGVGVSEQEQRYDRLVVYATIEEESFTTGELLTRLEGYGIAFDSAALERSLSRLELAFVLSRENQRWFYPVPLFRAYIQDDDPALKLAAVLRQGF